MRLFCLVPILVVVGCGRAPTPPTAAPSSVAAPRHAENASAAVDNPTAAPRNVKLEIQEGATDGTTKPAQRIRIGGHFTVSDASKPVPKLIARVVRSAGDSVVIEDSRAVEQERDGDIVVFDGTLRAPKKPGSYRVDVVGWGDTPVASAGLTVAD